MCDAIFSIFSDRRLALRRRPGDARSVAGRANLACRSRSPSFWRRRNGVGGIEPFQIACRAGFRFVHALGRTSFPSRMERWRLFGAIFPRWRNSGRCDQIPKQLGHQIWSIAARPSVAEAQNAARAAEIAIGLPLASKPSVLSARYSPVRRVRGCDGSMMGACTRLAVPRAAALDG